MTDDNSPRRPAEIAPRADVLLRSDPADAPHAYGETFKALLDDSVRELLAAQGFDAQGLERKPGQTGNAPCLAAFIGFGGDKLRGAVTAVAPTRFLELTHPQGKPVEPLTDAEAADWCCEFVNQLLGRLKNKLLKCGLAVQVSSPQAVLADHLRLAQSARGNLIVREYHVEDFELLICLDVSTTSGEALFDVPLENSDEMPSEGDLVLF
jgi:hypothetical protein